MDERLLAEITALIRIGSGVGSTAALETLLQASADAIARLLPADRVSLIEFDQNRHAVGFFVRGGPGRGQVVTTVSFQELEDGLSGWVLQQRRPALSPREPADPRESPLARQRRLDTGCGAILVVPLTVEDRVLGTVTAINRPDQRDFTEADAEVVSLFADYCAVVVENARLLLKYKEQNQMKDKLFTILAHDLRGPVGNTSVLLSLIADSLGESSEFGELLKEGTKAAYQTYDLLENLLGWVRGQMEQLVSNPTYIDVQVVAEHVRSWLHAQAGSKGVRIDIECRAGLSLLSDPRSVETILRNLVGNAVKYSGAGTKVTIRARSVPPNVVLEVEDQGEGMDPGKLASLFQVYKVDSRPGTRGERGNGLGLMFCADLARGLGARLEAESEPGRGSTFRLIVPQPAEAELVELL